MITEQDQCFARMSTVDVECPKCRCLRILSDPEPFKIYDKTALFECGGCGAVWQISVYLTEWSASLPKFTEERPLPGRVRVRTDAPRRGSSPAKRRRSAKTPRRIVGKRRAAK